MDITDGWYIYAMHIYIYLDCVTVNRDRLLMNETNRCTIISQLFINGNNSSTCFGQFFCPSSGAYQPYDGTGTIYAEISEVDKGQWCV